MTKKKSKDLLTKLELAVMRVIWNSDGQPMTVRDVSDEMNRSQEKTLAYNTIQTILTILREKGFVEAQRGPSRAHLFVSKKDRTHVSANMIGDLVDRLFDGRVEPLLHHLVDGEGLSRSELEDLRTFIETKLDDGEVQS
ncbi:MAG: putative transcriptional regulator [Planctomycetota bacterium]